jgi:hypothetical protein
MNDQAITTSSTRTADAVLVELGYPSLVVVAGRVSIADLYPSKSKRCGIYVLEHADGMHYIGQAVDVVRRYAQHRKLYPDIVRFSFFPCNRRSLDDHERRCIKEAESRGLRLRNRMLVKQLLVESDLDDVLDPAEQQTWLESPSHFNSESRLPLDPEQTHRLRYHSHFQRLAGDPAFAQVLALLKTYVGTCIPVARRTELSFWSVSCLPTTNHAHHPRWAAVNIGEMEMFVLGWLPKQKEPWAFVNVSRQALGTAVLKRLEQYGVAYETEQRGYRAAGGDDQTLSTSADTFTAMALALGDPDVARAARRLSLEVMRKRPNWYAKFHCFDLADCLL